VERYWSEYLSDNGRSLYRAAAELERAQGPGHTLGDIADHMGIAYASAQSIPSHDLSRLAQVDRAHRT
jgi:hypothetical protein